jgi:hypothetical protein
MRNGHIASVEILENVTDDTSAIKLGSASFLKRLREGFEGFEIWQRDRMVFRYPEDENQADPTSQNGKAGSKSAPKSQGKKALTEAPSCAALFYARLLESKTA